MNSVTEREPLRILLVDDHLACIESLGHVLRLLGHEVRTAVDGVEGLARAMDFQPDAALIDLSLPLINGFDVARYLRERPETKRTYLIALTDWASDVHTWRARAAGFDIHLIKPVAVTELTLALDVVHPASRASLRQRSH